MPFVGVIITRIEEGTTGTLEHWKNGRLE